MELTADRIFSEVSEGRPGMELRNSLEWNEAGTERSTSKKCELNPFPCGAKILHAASSFCPCSSLGVRRGPFIG